MVDVPDMAMLSIRATRFEGFENCKQSTHSYEFTTLRTMADRWQSNHQILKRYCRGQFLQVKCISCFKFLVNISRMDIQEKSKLLGTIGQLCEGSGVVSAINSIVYMQCTCTLEPTAVHAVVAVPILGSSPRLHTVDDELWIMALLVAFAA